MSDPVADARGAATLAVVRRFNEAFNHHDVDAIMALMTDDCLFDSTRPPPDGELLKGQAPVRAFWTGFFTRSPQVRFETEAEFAAGDHAAVRWIYHWVREGTPGHVRGVDLFLVRDGRIAEKRSYVKG